MTIRLVSPLLLLCGIVLSWPDASGAPLMAWTGGCCGAT